MNNNSLQDQHVALKNVPLGKWFILLGLFFVLCASCAWIIFGNVTGTLVIDGVVSGNEMPRNIYIGEAGYMVEQSGWNGDWITEGTPLIEYISQEDLDSHSQNQLAYNDIAPDKKTVVSPYDGYLVQTYKVVGDKLRKMDLIASIMEVKDGDPEIQIVNKDGKSNVLVMAVIKDSEMHLVKKGMEVRIEPEEYPKEEYGYIQGKVSDIDKESVSNEELTARLGNDDLADKLIKDDQYYHLVEIEIDSDKDGRLVWIGGDEGSEKNLKYSMVCNLEIVTNTYHPYEYLFNK